MTKYDELQARHQQLLEQQETSSDPKPLLDAVRAYIKTVQTEAEHIAAPRDRDQLRANLRYWASFVYDQTGTYPNTKLRPPSTTHPASGPAKPDPTAISPSRTSGETETEAALASKRGNRLFVWLGLIVVITVTLGFCGLFFSSNNSLPENELPPFGSVTDLAEEIPAEEQVNVTATSSPVAWQHVDLQDAQLTGVDDLSGGDFFKTNLSNLDLSNAILQNADLRGADLSRSNLSGADLSGADLRGANLSGANLVGANLSQADLRVAILTGANMNDTTQIDDKWRRVWKIVTEGAADQDLSGVDLSDAYLGQANLSGALLVGVDFSGTNLANAVLNKTNLHTANLTQANLTGANLRQAVMIDAVFNHTNLSNADLSGTVLTGTDLANANLLGANLSFANLIGANLGDANLAGANFTAADLADAHLSEANLEAADFTAADLTDANLR